ncbi:MAG: hypothetical protein KAJ48_08955 [Elusimicrobiales bacterium]|nr:hypothetical protein [Elusimicrobiales bacterium]
MIYKLNLFQFARPFFLFGFCAILIISGCKKTRSDDALEPNDTFQLATELTAGKVLAGRAKQENIDIFSFKCEAMREIVFSLQSIGLEDCAEFTVTGPGGDILYQDEGSFCDSPRELAMRVNGVKLEEIKNFGYKIYVPAKKSGKYFLSISERGRPDNIYPFSWDYKIKAEFK